MNLGSGDPNEMRLLLGIAALAAFTLLTSCTTETRHVSHGDIYMPDYKSRFHDVSRDKVYIDGKHVGYLVTSREIDGDHGGRDKPLVPQ